MAGVKMPRLIYGTAWKKERTRSLVCDALATGFRGIDTACQPKHYHEPGVGEALNSLTSLGLRREDVFLQTKFTPLGGQDPRNVPYDSKAPLPVQVHQSLAQSLRNLQTSYIDSLVLHSPVGSFETTLTVWRAMEDLVHRGEVRQLGMSNCYDPAFLERLVRETILKPQVIQNRFYAETGYDKELRAFCRKQGIYYQSFWTLSANPHILSHPAVTRVADHYGITSAQVLFHYLQRMDIIPLTGTSSITHMQEDLAALDLPIEPQHLSPLADLADW